MHIVQEVRIAWVDLMAEVGRLVFLCVLFALTLFALFKEALQALHYRVI